MYGNGGLLYHITTMELCGGGCWDFAIYGHILLTFIVCILSKLSIYYETLFCIRCLFVYTSVFLSIINELLLKTSGE